MKVQSCGAQGWGGVCLGKVVKTPSPPGGGPQPRERVQHPEKVYTTPGFELKSTKSPEKAPLAPRKCEKVVLSPEKVSPSKSTLFRGNFAPKKGTLAPEKSTQFFCPGKGFCVTYVHMSHLSYQTHCPRQ